MASFELFGLVFLGMLAWLWMDSLEVRECALAVVKAACGSEQLLLLDDTVAIRKVWLSRNPDGVMCLRRVYSFEYSDSGNDRTIGTVSLAGKRVLVIELNLRVSPNLMSLH